MLCVGRGDVFFSFPEAGERLHQTRELEERERLSECEKGEKATQECVMSPWQEEMGAVAGGAEQTSSLKQRSQGTPLPVLMDESHAETE